MDDNEAPDAPGFVTGGGLDGRLLIVNDGGAGCCFRAGDELAVRPRPRPGEDADAPEFDMTWFWRCTHVRHQVTPGGAWMAEFEAIELP